MPVRSGTFKIVLLSLRWTSIMMRAISDEHGRFEMEDEDVGSEMKDAVAAW
jgi:hypothetical protein